jgi:predicted amidophosphoribosyltransferase
MEIKERPACSTKETPFPADVICPGCGAGIEVWSDEDEAACGRCGAGIEISCGRLVLKKEGLETTRAGR